MRVHPLRLSFPNRFWIPTIAVAALLVSAPPSPAQGRARRPHVAPRPAAQTPGPGGLVTHDIATGGETPDSLVQALVGPGPVISNVRYRGARIAAGSFSGGTGIVGFESGIVLSSGNISTVRGPDNFDPNAGLTPNGLPGDPDLDALIPPETCCTHDATVLEFDLECPSGSAISFQYVFASDEYDTYPSGVDDVFACFVNGQNVAILPGTSDPIAIQSVNGATHAAFYRTNDCNTLGLGYPCSHLATEMDGLTVVLSATAVLQPGPNHVKLAIADSGDDVVDSNVLLRAQSLVCSPGLPVFETPSSCALVLDGFRGAPFVLDVNAWANPLPGSTVSLDATGDSGPINGGSFQPPLPTSPSQPGSTRFTWTPTSADLGLHHLTFTATDASQGSSSMDVDLRISELGLPLFDPPSPCGQVLEVATGLPLVFDVHASAWSSGACGDGGVPGESVTLDVQGDSVPLAGGTFVPPLPAGPAQPVSTRFTWTPTVADVGLYHLDFTATDRLQQTSSCGVDIHVSLRPPFFIQPSPCGETLFVHRGATLDFDVLASATNGAAGQAVVLSVAGDGVPLAGGTFTPPLPAGPAQPVSTHFRWSPTLADVGHYHLQFTATDQLQSSSSCGVDIQVLATAVGADVCLPGTGTVIPCPCGNPPVGQFRGCDNSAGTGGARLDSSGGASPGPSCTLVFTTVGEKPNALSILMQGGQNIASNGIVFGQGVRCAQNSLKRLYVKVASGGSITAPEPSDLSVWLRSCSLGDCLTMNDIRNYAVYYRDPTVLGSCPATSTFNITQTQQILWHP